MLVPFSHVGKRQLLARFTGMKKCENRSSVTEKSLFLQNIQTILEYIKRLFSFLVSYTGRLFSQDYEARIWILCYTIAIFVCSCFTSANPIGYFLIADFAAVFIGLRCVVVCGHVPIVSPSNRLETHRESGGSLPAMASANDACNTLRRLQQKWEWSYESTEAADEHFYLNVMKCLRLNY